MKIHGREAVKLKLVIDCNPHYWIDEAGDVWEHNDQSPYSEPRHIPVKYSESSEEHFVHPTDGRNGTPWDIEFLKEHSKVFIAKAKQTAEQPPEPPKQEYVIAKKVVNSYQVISAIWTNLEALANKMEELAKDNPGEEFFKLIIDTSVTAKLTTTYEVNWK